MSALDFSSDSEDDAAPVAAPVPAPTAVPVPKVPAVMLIDEDLLDEPEDNLRQTPIQNRWVFWFMHRGSHKGGVNQALDHFEQALIPVSSFQTVEHFWRVYDHCARPATIIASGHSGQTTYHVFKNGVKPTWEDPSNCRGGAWIVRLRKGLAARFWEELLLAMVGEQFDVGNEICGAKLSVRYNEDIISLWNRNADNAEANGKIRDQMRRSMRLPQFIPMEYKRHEVSITDKSSFRNTMVWSGAGGKGPDRGAAGKGDRGDRLGNPAFEHPGAPGGHYSRGGKGGDRGGNPAFEQQASGGDRWGASGLRGGGFEGGKGWAKDTAASRDLNAKWR